MNLQDIEKRYRNMSDDTFVSTAESKASAVRPEVLEIIKSEIARRNLSPAILAGIEAQRKEYTVGELMQYATLINELPCPHCDDNSRKLNATVTYDVKSFIVVTTSKKQIVVGCPDCLDRKNNGAMISSAILGWWGIPWGLLRTPVYIYRNMRDKRGNHATEPNTAFLSYTLQNIGEIEKYKTEPAKLKAILKR